MNKPMCALSQPLDSKVPADKPRPFVKWVGGKRSIMPKLLMRLPLAGAYKTYNELFIGGGALFWEVLPAKGVIADTNPHLIATYRAIKDDVQGVVSLLKKHKRLHSKAHFSQVRERLLQERSDVEVASDFIYLNKTCFNGLYRENRRGDFNVPIGSYPNPTLYERENLIAVAQRLAGASIRQASFDAVLESAQEGDLVYFDPPYFPASKTASFTNYAAGGFEVDLQVKLAKVFAELARRGCFVMLSNSDVPAMHELYAGWRLVTVSAARCINSSGAKRGPVGELLVKSW